MSDKVTAKEHDHQEHNQATAENQEEQPHPTPTDQIPPLNDNPIFRDNSLRDDKCDI
jgi:hypothetical protein